MIDVSDIKKDIQATEGRIRALQHQTIECVSFGPTGKVTVADKERLESLNTEIEAMQTLIANNGEVLNKLVELTGGLSLADLQLMKRRTEGHINKVKGCLSADLGELLKRNPGMDVESLGSHPKAVKLQAEAKAIFDQERPELERLTALLDHANKILDSFTPVGQKDQGGYANCISRPDVGGVA